MQQASVNKERPREPIRFSKRVGSTTYRVNVYYSRTSKETMDDKIIRLIRNETVGKEVTQ